MRQQQWGKGGHLGRSHSGGFTLIEVLVALVIAAVSLMAAMRAAGALTMTFEQTRLKAYAQWSADNYLAQLRLKREFPRPGREQKKDCSQGTIALTCVADFQAVQNPTFLRVDVRVYAGGDNEGSSSAAAQTANHLVQMFGYVRR